MNDENRPQRDPHNPYSSGWSAERPEHSQYDVHEGEYLPPDAAERRERQKNVAKGLGGAGIGIAVILAKFKGLLLLLLNFKWFFVLAKVAGPLGTFFLSVVAYSLFWGWKFALVFVLMLAAHELGHYFALRGYGLPAKLPMFVPFLGAYTTGGIATNLEHDAYVALAGPLTGLGVSAAALWFGYQTQQPFWYAAAYLGAFLNLFNCVPVQPLDGGRVAGALSPALWIVGVVIIIALALTLHTGFFILLFVLIFGLPSMIAAWKGHVDPRFAAMTTAARTRVALWYLATIGGLGYIFSISHVAVPR
jgi:Zn-dependent protease